MPAAGSPPPAWGIRVLNRAGCFSQRFTPTRVGHTGLYRTERCAVPVHPHPRGAYLFVYFENITKRTVHPHPRGAYIKSHSFMPEATRFTPTRVGHTQQSVMRVCSVTGSPPPAWGILFRDCLSNAEISVHPHPRGAYHLNLDLHSRPVRFTPTRVGHTLR